MSTLEMKGTTILALRKGGKTVLAGDGQVTMGNTVVKATARKVRRLHDRRVLAGFAGSTADAFTLFERFEGKLEQHAGNLTRSAVELAKDWRTDKSLRRLEAMLIVGDEERILLISGNGDVIEPDGDVIAVGSGGPYALAAAKALLDSDKSAEEIAKRAMAIAAEICIYTNENAILEILP